MLNDKARQLLANPRGFAVLGTTFRDGTAHVTPIWVDMEGDTVCFNTATGRVKTRHLERDPRACVTLMDLDDPYEYVELRGRVRSVTGPEAEQHIDRLAQKYLGRETYPWRVEGQQRVKYFMDVAHVSGM
jgi:PPOX class probable F420-dependent enzyme